MRILILKAKESINSIDNDGEEVVAITKDELYPAVHDEKTGIFLHFTDNDNVVIGSIDDIKRSYLIDKITNIHDILIDKETRKSLKELYKERETYYSLLE